MQGPHTVRVSNPTRPLSHLVTLQHTAPETSAACVQDAPGSAGSQPQHKAGAAPLSADAGRAVSGHDATPQPTQPAEPATGSTRLAWQGLEREKPLVLGVCAGVLCFSAVQNCLPDTHGVVGPWGQARLAEALLFLQTTSWCSGARCCRRIWWRWACTGTRGCCSRPAMARPGARACASACWLTRQQSR